MTAEQQKPRPLLDGLHVLDLTDEKGQLCGKMLANMGAEVIKVERVGGDPARKCGPFYHGDPHPEKSIFWFAYNTNKKGITLNIETATGQQLFRKLAKKYDCIIESFDPGYLDKLGLGYKQLSKENPRVIMTSITPFGQSGPYKGYKGPDLITSAMSGTMFLAGDPDRPPVRVSFPMANSIASVDAAVATIMAYYYRERTGEGQQIDLSIQQSYYWHAMNVSLFWREDSRILQRAGQRRTGRSSAGNLRQIWPCKDGAICFYFLGGTTGPPMNKALVEWMDSEGMADDFLKSIDWFKTDVGRVDAEWIRRTEEPMAKFFMSHTKEEIYQGAIKYRIIMFPVNTAEDIAHDAQLASRKFWEQVEHPALGATITYPGAFVRGTANPCVPLRRAPLIGEHNEEIYVKEIGLSGEQLVTLKETGVI